ncbi:MAG: Rrf2 family transcriptional regulator [Chloroflexi bacterium]|nr:Rrf2 family transcriptional regulator [Chloroflexota bacterium]
MHIAKRTDYGVRALIDLAEHAGEGPVQSADIAARQGIPGSFLEQVLGALRKAGLVRSSRGRQGGHMLAAAPDRITLADVVLALEGPSLSIECVDDPAECDKSAACTLREVWQDADRASQRVLVTTSIGELVRRQQERCAAPMYYI